MRGRTTPYLLLLLALAGPAGEACAQEVVAVLSSELGPYLEAFEGFKEEMDQSVAVVSLSAGQTRLKGRTRVVVAFGSKAALEAYPEEVGLVYCMAPGAVLNPGQRSGVVVRVHMLTRAEALVRTFKRIQPPLRRLAVFWILNGAQDYLQQMSQAAAALHIEVAAERLGSADELPERLRRAMLQGVDALWVPPDPLLINAQSFSVLKEFSWANNVPFYAPTAGFVEEGAVASVAVSFRQIGRAAARAARQVLKEGNAPAEIYPEESEVTLNLDAASRCGMSIPQEVVRAAHRVLPAP